MRISAPLPPNLARQDHTGPHRARLDAWRRGSCSPASGRPIGPGQIIDPNPAPDRHWTGDTPNT
eukprot:5258807-Alexandrium_andersonii.AAC.1